MEGVAVSSVYREEQFEDLQGLKRASPGTRDLFTAMLT